MIRCGFAVLALTMVAGIHQAQALYIPFKGTIDTSTALLSSGIGNYQPLFASDSFSGAIGTDAAGNFYGTLQLPSFSTAGPGCGTPSSGCGVYTSDGSFLVTDDAGAPLSFHNFAQSGNVVSFSVGNGLNEGEIMGTLDLGAPSGTISVSLYAGSAFRADNPSTLTAELNVLAVPLPSSAPLLGTALLAFGVSAAAARVGRTRRSAHGC